MRLVSALGNVGRGNVVNVAITVAGPIYGIGDLEERVREVGEREVGNILYDIQRRGVR
jgi:L-arabinose isomerase